MGDEAIFRRRRRFSAVLAMAIVITGVAFYNELASRPVPTAAQPTQTAPSELATESLTKLEIKGRASKSGYTRAKFGSGWAESDGCDTRNIILKRDLTDVALDGDGCKVLTGKLNDPYSGQMLEFRRGTDTSNDVQIDHMVALSDSWQKGAQLMSSQQRIVFSNDPLNLMAVDGPLNVQKGGSDAASWLPPNKSYRCRYVARQIAVKVKYAFWVTQAEFDAFKRVLQSCPDQRLPVTR